MFSILVSNYYVRFPDRKENLSNAPMPIWIMPWFFLWFSLAVKEQAWPNMMGMLSGYMFTNIRSFFNEKYRMNVFEAPDFLVQLCNKHYGTPEANRLKRERLLNKDVDDALKVREKALSKIKEYNNRRFTVNSRNIE